MAYDTAGVEVNILEWDESEDSDLLKCDALALVEKFTELINLFFKAYLEDEGNVSFAKSQKPHPTTSDSFHLTLHY